MASNCLVASVQSKTDGYFLDSQFSFPLPTHWGVSHSFLLSLAAGLIKLHTQVS